MVDVDNLTDAELRSKLIEFGFPVMPITGTTRKTMAKKLKMLLENKNKISKDSRRSLGRYSSEEESDSETKSTKDKFRRQTMAAPLQPPKRKPKVEPEPVRKEIKTQTTTTRTMKILQNSKDEFDTGSESDEVAEKYERTPPRLPPSFEAASDRLNQIRSRLSTQSFYSSDDLLKDKENTPFLSNFTKRLSQLSDSPNSPVFDYKSDIIKENDVNGGASTSRSYLSRYPHCQFFDFCHFFFLVIGHQEDAPPPTTTNLTSRTFSKIIWSRLWFWLWHFYFLLWWLLSIWEYVLIRPWMLAVRMKMIISIIKMFEFCVFT